MRQLRVPAELGLRFLGICPLCRRGGDISPTMPWGRKRVLSPVGGCEFGQVECVGFKARQNTAGGGAGRRSRTGGVPLGFGPGLVECSAGCSLRPAASAAGHLPQLTLVEDARRVECVGFPTRQNTQRGDRFQQKGKKRAGFFTNIVFIASSSTPRSSRISRKRVASHARPGPPP